MDKLKAIEMVIDYEPVSNPGDIHERYLSLIHSIVKTEQEIFSVDEVCRMIDSIIEE